MKIVKYFFITLLLLPVLLWAQQPKVELQEFNLKGKVKILWESHYIAVGEPNNYEEIPNVYSYDRMIYFDRKGRKTEEYWYMADQGTNERLHSRWTFHYNLKGKMDTCVWLDADSTVISRWTYSYNAQGKETEILLYDGVFDYTLQYKHRLNAAGQKIQTTTVDSRGDYSYNTDRFYYDNLGNKIKEESGGLFVDENRKEQWGAEWECVYRYDSKGRLVYKSGSGEYDTHISYQYDNKGRLITIKQGLFDDFGYSLTTYCYDLQGNILKQNKESVHDMDLQQLKKWEARCYTALEQEESRTYQYEYEESNGVWNWNRRAETIDGKEIYITNRSFEYYEN